MKEKRLFGILAGVCFLFAAAAFALGELPLGVSVRAVAGVLFPLFGAIVGFFRLRGIPAAAVGVPGAVYYAAVLLDAVAAGHDWILMLAVTACLFLSVLALPDCLRKSRPRWMRILFFLPAVALVLSRTMANASLTDADRYTALFYSGGFLGQMWVLTVISICQTFLSAAAVLFFALWLTRKPEAPVIEASGAPEAGQYR